MLQKNNKLAISRLMHFIAMLKEIGSVRIFAHICF